MNGLYWIYGCREENMSYRVKENLVIDDGMEYNTDSVRYSERDFSEAIYNCICF